MDNGEEIQGNHSTRSAVFDGVIREGLSKGGDIWIEFTLTKGEGESMQISQERALAKAMESAKARRPRWAQSVLC